MNLKIKNVNYSKAGEKLYFCKTIVSKGWDGKAQGCFWDWENQFLIMTIERIYNVTSS